MNLKEIEGYWREAGQDALDTAFKLYEQNKYVHSLFFLHLSIEKTLKGLYVNRNKEEAPFGHSLQILISKINDVAPDKDYLKFLVEVTTFNIATRYNDYKKSFYKTCTKDFASQYLNEGKEVILWLESLFR
ncbi:MAG TPA: HEPN domain-containing protein [Ignavibacteriaceae bacterium]|jgi:HEPN domain-containing protein|nr:HEPN domain-containing protein [Ignavibacteriaceae bacterium]